MNAVTMMGHTLPVTGDDLGLEPALMKQSKYCHDCAPARSTAAESQCKEGRWTDAASGNEREASVQQSEAMRNTLHGGMGWHEAWLNAQCLFGQPKLYSNTSGLNFTPFP